MRIYAPIFSPIQFNSILFISILFSERNFNELIRINTNDNEKNETLRKKRKYRILRKYNGLVVRKLFFFVG